MGKNYICLGGVSAWCSGKAAAYEPGAGFGWESAWKIYNSYSDEADAEVKMMISQADLDKAEAELTSGEMMIAVKESIATLNNIAVEAITPGADTNPDNVKRVESIIDATRWDYLFPRRDAAYTYDNLLKSIGKPPRLCGNFDDGRDADLICRKTLATMFAHFTQETGEHSIHRDVPEWRQALHWV